MLLACKGLTAFPPGLSACTEAKGEGGNKGDRGGTWKAEKSNRERGTALRQVTKTFGVLRAARDALFFDYMRPYDTRNTPLGSSLRCGAYGTALYLFEPYVSSRFYAFRCAPLCLAAFHANYLWFPRFRKFFRPVLLISFISFWRQAPAYATHLANTSYT